MGAISVGIVGGFICFIAWTGLLNGFWVITVFHGRIIANLYSCINVDLMANECLSVIAHCCLILEKKGD
jgi:uncharacterized membrane protein